MTDERPTPDRGIGLGASSKGLSSTRWPGATPIMSGRRRGRGPFVVIVVILGVLGIAAVALGVIAGVLVILHGSTNRDEQRAEAFLSAWSKHDVHAMQTMVDPSANVAADLTAVSAHLPVSHAAYHLDAVHRHRRGATATFTVHEVVAGVGPWSYQSSFDLVSASHGLPTVRWTRAVIHPRLGPHDVLDRTTTWAARAPILGTADQVLAGRLDVVTVGVEPQRMTDQADLSKALADTLHVDPKTVDADLHAPGVKPNYFVPIVTVPMATYLAAKPVIYPIPGLEFQAHKGYASTSSGFARVLLGTVAPITAEQLTQLGAPYEASDQVGQYGLEAAYERTLAGTPSTDIRVVDPTIADQARRAVAILVHNPGRAPVALRTTIDPAIQADAEAAMASIDKPAALVAIDGQGNIRAVVSKPLDQQFDRALDGEYPPGSTFKVATTEALLTAGLSPSSSLTCPTSVTVDGKVFHNFESESQGQLSLTTAFARSCNTAFIGATVKHLSGAQLSRAAAVFGFDQNLHLGVTTVGGHFPSGGGALETAADAIGQGQVTASPMQMASVAAAVMSGHWRPPMLLLGHTTQPPAPTTLDPTIRADLATLMRGVVTGGTGTAAAVPGLDVAGKTGTAEFGNADPPHTHAWFIGFSGNLAVAVIVEDGGVGGQTAAPIAGKFFALAR